VRPSGAFGRRPDALLTGTLAWVVLLAAAGCATGSALSGRIGGLADIVEQAERNGAYQCAPRAFAMARAHLEFAETELAQGDAVRAQEHFDIAEPNAHAAFRMSPAARCAPRGVVVVDRPAAPVDEDSDGDGILDSRDQCILEPEDQDGYLDTDGCPDPDNDLDGIADADDSCANDPEDLDGYRDEDGCPDRDNDADSISDVDDRCPNEPGPVEEQGCPRVYQDVQVTRTAIRITQTIHFDTNRATIRSVSFPILNTVAQALRDYPDIRIEVGGHTDSRAGDDFNLRLSNDRANAVRQYLIEQGIAAERMTARGYGEARPIESNRTSAGRAANRRVEFQRTDAAAQEP
jgi:outer membrane protein OmpA-like peptidoglycan-associated protein